MRNGTAGERATAASRWVMYQSAYEQGTVCTYTHGPIRNGMCEQLHWAASFKPTRRRCGCLLFLPRIRHHEKIPSVRKIVIETTLSIARDAVRRLSRCRLCVERSNFTGVV